jgi:hypothetical protein
MPDFDLFAEPKTCGTCGACILEPRIPGHYCDISKLTIGENDPACGEHYPRAKENN